MISLLDMSCGRGIVQKVDQKNITNNHIDESRKEEQGEKVWFEVVIRG